MAEHADGLHWVPEARVLDICGLARGTWDAWAKQGLVHRSPDSAYDLDELLQVALVVELRKHLSIDDSAAAWRALERTGEAAHIVRAARGLKDSDRFDLVIEPTSATVSMALDDERLAQAVRHPDAPRTVLVISPGAQLRRVTEAFWNRALRGPRPDARRRGRPKASGGVVHKIRESARAE